LFEFFVFFSEVIILISLFCVHVNCDEWLSGKERI
jgi:hypothetical protein